MQNKLKPAYDYMLCKAVVKDTAAVTGSDITTTQQHYEVLEVGPGRYYEGVFIEPTTKVGDIIWVQKHSAEGDTPKELYDQGYALILASRVMATEA